MLIQGKNSLWKWLACQRSSAVLCEAFKFSVSSFPDPGFEMCMHEEI